MISYRILAILALATVALADEQFSHPPPPPKPETTSGFNIGKQFNANLNLQKTGQASGSIYALGGFQAGPGPSYYTAANNPDPTPPAAAPSNGYFQYDATQVQQPGSTSLFSSSNVNYYATGAVILGVVLAYAVWVALFNFGGAAKLRELGEEFESAKEDEKTVPVSKKSRRRRAIQKQDEAARLAQIVLSAIESGACLEKSICLMGSQIGGTAKGRLASTVLEKLVPKNVQGNSYFITLYKALKGEIDCNMMACSS